MKDEDMPKKYDAEFKARAVRMVREHQQEGLDPESWTRCHFGYAASGSVAEAAAS